MNHHVNLSLWKQMLSSLMKFRLDSSVAHVWTDAALCPHRYSHPAHWRWSLDDPYQQTYNKRIEGVAGEIKNKCCHGFGIL